MKTETKNKGGSKDRRMEIRRRSLLIGCAVLVVICTLVICVVLSRLAVRNVDTKEGIAAIQKLEQADPSEVEGQLRQIEESQQKALEDWKNRPLKEKFAGSLILGDGTAEGFLDYEVLDSASVLEDGDVILSDMEWMIGKAEETKPKALFLALGRNDVLQLDGDAQKFAEQYRTLLSTLRERLPETRIYVNLVLPVQEKVIAEEADYAKIPDFNEALKNLCEEERITVLDVVALASADYYEPDGLHMTASYYSAWAEFMAEVSEI